MKKRLICCLIVLAMCAAVFAGCATGFDEADFETALNVLKKDVGALTGTTPASYSVPNKLGEESGITDAKGNPATIYVQWKIEGNSAVRVTKNDDDTSTVNIPANLTSKIEYTLKGTLVNKKGTAYLDSNKQAYTASFPCATEGAPSGGGGGGTSSYPAGGGGTTISSPYTVAQAIAEANKLASGSYSTDYYYVKGVVGEISFTGDATKSWSFEMKDAGGTDILYGYYVYLGSGMTTVDKGDVVIVYGKLQNYQGNKPELTTKSTDNPLTTLVKNETKGLSGDIKSNGSSTGGGNNSGNTGGGATGGNGQGVQVNGKTITITFSANGYGATEVVNSLTAGSLTLTISKGTGKTEPTYYANGTSLRLYPGNTLKITGATIAKVEFTFAQYDNTNEITSSPSGFSGNTWTGSTDELTFTIGGTKDHRRIASITITLA